MKKKTKRVFSQILAVCMAVSITLPYAGPKEAKATENLTDGLIGHWTFDGSDTEALANAAGNSSYTGQAATAGVGVVRKTDGGVSGGSLYFSKQDESYFRLPNIINAAEPFTIAAWVKYDKAPFSENNDNINLFQQTGDGKTVLFLNSERRYKTFLTGEEGVEASPEVELGKWMHVAVASDPATGKFQYYINGQLAQTNTLNTNNYPNAVTDLYVGAHKTPEAKSAMKGSVDELRFYNKVTNADTIKALYDEFAAELEIQELKENLHALIQEAKELKGGTGEAEAVLSEKKTEANTLYQKEGADAAELNDMIADLSEAIKAYKRSSLVPVEIEVDTSSVSREISGAMFGINHRYHNDGYSSWNTAKKQIEPEFNKLTKEASFGSVRYPGGTIANLYDWKHAIDHSPAGERGTIHGNPSDRSPITPNFGVDEAMKWICDELDSEAVWVYGMGQGSAADAADLFEYLNAPADKDATNPNGGTDWAEIRAQNGHPEPYGVTRFEIGNEMGLWEQNYWMDGRGGRSFGDAYVNGGEMTFTKQRAVKEYDWRDSAAVSDGNAGQVLYARYKFVKEGSAHVYVNDTEWPIVESLAGQGANNVCTLEPETGKITFGDGTNGNIPTSGAVITVTYVSTQDGFTAYYDTLNSIAEELDMEIEVYSCMETAEAITELEKTGKYDGAVIHPYSETNQAGNGSEHAYIKINDDDPEFYEKLLGRSLQHNIARVRDLTSRMGDGKVPVISEFGIYNHNTKFTRSIGHAVYLANEMINYIDMGTPYLNKHCLVDYPYGADNLGSGAQCVIQALKQPDGSVRFVSTPSAQMFSIFNNMTGNQRVGETIKGNKTYYAYKLYNKTYNVPLVKVLSSKDEEGNAYVTVINNHKAEETAMKLKIDERNLSGQEIAVWHLTSENADDENTLTDPDPVKVQKNTVTGNGEYLTYFLAPHSITSFKIPKEPAPIEKTATVSVKAETGGRASSNLAEAVVGASVTVTAVPDKGYVFDGWYDNDGQKISEESSYTFKLLDNTELTAKFEKTTPLPPVEKTVSVTAEAGGTASSSHQKAVAGTSVTVTAVTDTGYEFDGWYDTNGQKISDSNVYTFRLSDNTELTAKFTKTPIADPEIKDPPPQPQLPGTGEKVSDSVTNGTYQVLSSGTAGVTVAYTGSMSKNKTTYTVPNMVTINGIDCKVTALSANAFKNNKKMTSVTIGANITKIGNNAFWGCSKLKRVSGGNGVTEIGTKAFYKCIALTSVTIPAKVKKIGKQAFQGDKKLNKITIQTKKLTKKNVGKNAFKGIHAKAKIRVPSKKLKAYKKMLKSRGVPSKAKISK